jgi:hypothetical protein
MKDTSLRIGGQLLISVVALCCFYPSSFVAPEISALKLIFYVVVSTFVVWELLRLCIYQARRFYPGIRYTRQRLLFVGCMTLLIVAVSPFLRFYLGDLINIYGNAGGSSGDIYAYFRIVGQNIFYCLFISATYEAIYFFQEWKKAFREASDLRQATLYGQFNSLREQVNPHFLFNTLNTLTALIPQNAEKAESFALEMADVYRYLLRMNQYPLIDLEQEIAFIHSYTTLLRTRFNDNFSLEVLYKDGAEGHLLPPLTLQLLVENAVKHNVVSSRMPLTIFIEVHKDELLVKNHLQPKVEPVQSEYTGLFNLSERYRLLGIGEVYAGKEHDSFVVRLPFKKIREYERIDY